VRHRAGTGGDLDLAQASIVMTRDSAPLVVISIVSWNTADLTLACVESVLALDYSNFRVVVIDNDSVDDSVPQIRRSFSGVTIIELAENRGFAVGHAATLELARELGAEAIWLVNSDARVEIDALSKLVDAWKTHGDALYGGLPVREQDGEITIDFPAKFLPPDAMPRAWLRDTEIRFDEAWGSAPARKVGAVMGTTMLVPMRVVERHGWMDRRWFLYCEEIDYCYRLRAQGVESILVPQSRVRHLRGGSHLDRAAVGDCVAYYRARNEIALAQRHGAVHVAAVWAVKKTMLALRTLMSRPSRTRMILAGVIDALKRVTGKRHAPEWFLDRGLPPLRKIPEFRPERLSRKLTTISRRLFQKERGCCIDRVGASNLAFDPEFPLFVRQFYFNCILEIERALVDGRHRLNVIIGKKNCAFDNTNRTLRIGLQWEHTLVKPGGRDSDGAPRGQVPIEGGGESYLVRLQDREFLESCDLVIDYSRPNLVNLERSPQFASLVQKFVYLAPLLYDFAPDDRRRKFDIVTLFADTAQPRRRELLDRARAAGLPIRNVAGIFSHDGLRRLYDRTRILVNLHQTEHHHTFEELRVLPALLRGVVVVSENVPLREEIPYHRFIVWADAASLIETVRDVQENYAAYRARLIESPKLQQVLHAMKAANRRNIETALRRFDA
jgi:GT2 family glycosyltransferase